MINLSKRLKTVAELIEENSKVIDVGCDHGLLDIYLVQNKNCSCLATDISATCLEKAKYNIKINNLEDKIETKVTNGLEGIEYRDYDYIVITGMGAKTIMKILENKIPSKLIIQSNNNIEELKRFLNKRYKLLDELVVYENGIYYVILYLEKGKQKLKYSDYIVYKKNNKDYINHLIKKYTKILNKMPNKYLFKKIKLYIKITILKNI